MSVSPAKMSVFVGEHFACVKIVGWANFTSSVDFKTLISELRQRGYKYFVLDLSECALMDSTFLGVLAGFGLKLWPAQQPPPPPQQQPNHAVELLNPNARITELLENLGILHLFKLRNGSLQTPAQPEAAPAHADPSREELTRACLEAHQTLMQVNPDNVPRFKEVAQFLAEDLKKLQGRERP